MPKTVDNIKKWGLALAIAIILVSLVHVALSTIYPEPEREWEACNDMELVRVALPYCNDLEDAAERESCLIEQREAQKVEQTESKKCYDEQQEKRSEYSKIAFMVKILAGILILVLGLVAFKVSAVSYGFVIGGFFNLFLAIVTYWSDIQDVVRLLILVAVLILLVWVGYKKLGKK